MAALYFAEKAGDYGLVKAYLDIANSFNFDLRQRVRYFQKAACLGNLFAIALMVKCWEQGMGVPRNSNKAYGWRWKLPTWIR